MNRLRNNFNRHPKTGRATDLRPANDDQPRVNWWPVCGLGGAVVLGIAFWVVVIFAVAD